MAVKGLKLKRKSSLGATRAMLPQYLAHEDEPTDRHTAHLAQDSTSTDGPDSSGNLFDDSDSENQKWTQIVRKYLSRLS